MNRLEFSCFADFLYGFSVNPLVEDNVKKKHGAKDSSLLSNSCQRIPSLVFELLR